MSRPASQIGPPALEQRRSTTMGIKERRCLSRPPFPPHGSTPTPLLVRKNQQTDRVGVDIVATFVTSVHVAIVGKPRSNRIARQPASTHFSTRRRTQADPSQGLRRFRTRTHRDCGLCHTMSELAGKAVVHDVNSITCFAENETVRASRRAAIQRSKVPGRQVRRRP